jgi:CRP-like cAMP-binding protein
VVRGVEHFGTITDEECHRVAASLVYTPFSAGEVVTARGHVAHHLYLLASGRVEVRLTLEGQNRLVNTLTAPDFFGEMGLLTGAPRSADIVAAEAVEAYKLDRTAFEGVLQSRPEVAGELAQITAARQTRLQAVAAGAAARDDRAAERREAAAILARMREFFGLER